MTIEFDKIGSLGRRSREDGLGLRRCLANSVLQMRIVAVLERRQGGLMGNREELDHKNRLIVGRLRRRRREGCISATRGRF